MTGRPREACIVGEFRPDANAREIVLSRGLVALVDEADVASVVEAGKWYADPGPGTFYARRNFWVDGKSHALRMHNLITGWDFVDHINGDGLDNRRDNLRPASATQNVRNVGLNRTNTSGYKGVSWHKVARRWEAYITADGKRRALGRFDDPRSAAHAYDEAARVLHGEFAWLNFPDVTPGGAQ